MITPAKYLLTPAKTTSSIKQKIPDYMPLFTSFVSENVRIQSQWVFSLLDNLENLHANIFPPDTPEASMPCKNIAFQFPLSPQQERQEFANLAVDLELVDPCDVECRGL